MRLWRTGRQLALLQSRHFVRRTGSEGEATATRGGCNSTPPSSSAASPSSQHPSNSLETLCSSETLFRYEWGGRRNFTRGSAPATCGTAPLFLRRHDELLPGESPSVSDRSTLHLSFTSSPPSGDARYPAVTRRAKVDERRAEEGVSTSMRSLGNAVLGERGAAGVASTSRSDDNAAPSLSLSARVRRELSSRSYGGLQPLLAFVETRHWEFDASNACHALAILNARSRWKAGIGKGWLARRQQRVLELLAACLESCVWERGGISPRDISNALHALVKLGHKDKPWALLEVAVLNVDSFNAVDTFQLLWAMGKARMREHRLLGVFEGRCVSLLPQLAPFQVANLLWVYSVLEHPAPRLFEAALPLLQPAHLDDGPLLSVLWAVAAAEELPTSVPTTALFDAALSTAFARLPSLSVRHVGIVLEAFTRVGHPGITTLLECVRNGPLLSDCNAFVGHPAALAQVLWAFAVAGERRQCGEVCARLQAATIKVLPVLRPSDLAQVLWSHAVSDASGVAGLLIAAEPHVRRARHAMRPGDVCRSAWVYGSTGGDWANLVNELSREVAGAVGELSAGELAEAGWAFARLRHACPLLFRGLETQAHAMLSDFTLSQLAALLWAFVEVRWEAPQLFSDVAASIGTARGSCAAEVALVVWACIAGGASGRKSLAYLARLAHSAALEADESTLAMLMEAQLVIRAEDASAPALIPPRLNSSAWRAWVNLVKRDTSSGGGSRSIAVEAAIRGMGYECDTAWICTGGLERRCLVVERPGGRVAHVEVVEEESCLRGGQLLGSVLMRRRAVQACGWAPLQVPFTEWEALGGDEPAKYDYLARLLAIDSSDDFTGISVAGWDEGVEREMVAMHRDGDVCQGGR